MKKDNISLDEKTLRTDTRLIPKMVAFGVLLSREFYRAVKDRVCPFDAQFGYFRYDFTEEYLNRVFELGALHWNKIKEAPSDRDRAMSLQEIESALAGRIENRLMSQAEANTLFEFIKLELEVPTATAEFLRELAKSPLLTSWIEQTSSRAEFERLQRHKGTRSLKPQDLLDAYENTMKCVNPGINNLGKPRKLKELDRPADDHPDRLLGNRFLVKGAIGTLIGPTGVGKSSLILQMAMCFAAGLPCLGIVPARPLRTLILQAENDEGDLAEMRDGVIAGLGLSPQQEEAAGDNVHIVEVAGVTGEDLVRRVLVPLIRQYSPDLVVIDPALAFLRGDTKEQVDVSAFLRGQLWPVAKQYDCAIIVVHHMNRPSTTRDRVATNWTDYAYSGSGSAEWANVPRASLTLRPTQIPGQFELIAGKRFQRLGWTDSSGNPTASRFIRHSRVAGFICWLNASSDEIAQIQPEEDPKTRTMIKLSSG